MNDVIGIGIAIAIGLSFGVLYFGGLWLTVRKLVVVRHPGILHVISLLLRLSVLLSAFYLLLSIGGWQMVAIALLGFIAARYAVIHVVRRRLSEADHRGET